MSGPRTGELLLGPCEGYSQDWCAGSLWRHVISMMNIQRIRRTIVLSIRGALVKWIDPTWTNHRLSDTELLKKERALSGRETENSCIILVTVMEDSVYLWFNNRIYSLFIDECRFHSLSLFWCRCLLLLKTRCPQPSWTMCLRKKTQLILCTLPTLFLVASCFIFLVPVHPY